MIAAELIALLGFQLDEESVKKVDEFFNRAKTKLGAFGEQAAKYLTQGFAAFFAGDIYEAVKCAALNLLSYLNPVQIAQGTKAFADSADAVGKMAVALGMSTDEVQEFKFVAQQAGVNAEDLNKSVSKITAGVGEAVNGSKEWQGVLKSIGLDYRQLSTMSPADRFAAVIEGLNGVEDSTKRAALATKFFEEQAPRFAGLINGGAAGLDALRQKSRELGNIIPPEAIDNAGKLNERIDFLTARLDGLKQKFYAAVLPALEAFASAVLAFVEDNYPAFERVARLMGSAVAYAFEGAARAVRFAATSVATFTAALRPFVKLLEDAAANTRLLGILTVALGVAWGFVNRVQVTAFFSSLVVQLQAVASWLAVNALGALTFLRSLTLSSLWNAATLAFARLSAAMVGTTAQFIIIAGSIFFLLIALEDLYTFFDGGESVFGDNLGIDSASVDIENMTFGLMAVGVMLGLLLVLFNPLLGALAILILMVAYLAANWDLVLASFDAMYEAMIDGLADLMLAAYDGLAGVASSIADFFMGILDTVRDVIGGIVGEISALPGKARDMLSKLPGVNLFGDGAEIAGAVAGDGALNPSIDASAAAARVASSRSVTIAPTISLQVDARDRTTEDATGVVRGAVESELWRELNRAYDGDED